MIIDEMITFFAAGMKTIQISSTNLVYYLTKHDDIREKMLKEILPVVEKVKDNIKDGLDHDSVQDLDYFNMCYKECLRKEPPAANTITQTVDPDTVVGTTQKFTLKKGMNFMFSIESIQNDPIQWPEPTRFEPDRFNTSLPNNKWLLDANGQKRNPLAFCPFFGGSRSCIGKAFAETCVRYTFPIIYHHLEFAFVDPVKQKAEKPYYSVAGSKELDCPVKVTIRNKVIR